MATGAIMAAKEISVRKYVVRLSGEERERLEAMIRKRKSPARRVIEGAGFVEGRCLGRRQSRRSQAPGRALRMALHSKTRKLARSGRVRTGVSEHASASYCRIPDKQTLIDEIAAWEYYRNANHTKADWQFTTKNARINLSIYTLQSD